MDKEIIEFNCPLCNFTTTNKANWFRHNETKKHKRKTRKQRKKEDKKKTKKIYKKIYKKIK